MHTKTFLQKILFLDEWRVFWFMCHDLWDKKMPCHANSERTYCGYVVSKKGTITFDISQSVTLLPSKYDAIINLGCKIGITESATFL